MDKPNEGRWQCMACGQVWQAAQVMIDPQSIGGRLCCGDVFCGGSVVRVDKPTWQDALAPADTSGMTDTKIKSET